ncbi:hypothetical protein PGTUg99_020250 [Puccinia graminis f. sp. tritici]|uniref:Uncharacterized protein n=1 Tax=Puccinia graminis f. sp. tritici TaxID=56615 RepID=A0A5B0M8T2_PUCGR|nr:hypothetical protein PGTUg99_020250 [Puccinia graminis f. sp. tritici]
MEPPESQSHKRTYSNLEDQPEHSRIDDLYLRFKKLHPCDDLVDESFSLFLKNAQEHLVAKYLDLLEEFFEALDSEGKLNIPLRDYSWSWFIERQLSLDQLSAAFSITDQKHLQNKALKLAILRNYPQFHDQPQITRATMLRALRAKSEEEGCRILKTVSRPGLFSSRVSGNVIKKGYDSNFLRSEMIVSTILQKLDEYSKQWKTPDYYAPYAALIGPSMCGKTRLLMEMSQHICVIFICLRPTDSTGYPPRSALADTLLKKDAGNSETYYNSVLAAIFQVVADFFNRQNRDMIKEGRFMTKQERLKEWNDYTQVASLGSLDRTRRTQEAFKKDVEAELKKSPDTTLHEAVRAMSESTEFITNPDQELIKSGHSLKVLLALDEARALLKTYTVDSEQSRFRTFGRSIRNIASDMGFFTILVDTTSHVAANFSLGSKFDPSARYDFVGEDQLFAPIYEIASFDAMVPTEPPRSWRELVSPERLFKYGYPIFGAYYRDAIAEKQKPEEIHNAILELAHFKLLGPTEHTQSSRIVTKAQAFAFLGPAIQPRINGAYHLNRELIASHSAICDHISPGCEMVMSNYPSQFTFAAAAMKFLKDERKLIDCIKALTTILLHGLDGTGGAGELASRIILLCAMQAALPVTSREGIVYGRPVRLVNFLKVLTGREEKDLDLGSIGVEQREDLLNHGMIFWNHFSLIKYTPTPSDLLECMYRGMAAQCHPNQSGIDQIFTIYLKRDSDDLDPKNV